MGQFHRQQQKTEHHRKKLFKNNFNHRPGQNLYHLTNIIRILFILFIDYNLWNRAKSNLNKAA